MSESQEESTDVGAKPEVPSNTGETDTGETDTGSQPVARREFLSFGAMCCGLAAGYGTLVAMGGRFLYVSDSDDKSMALQYVTNCDSLTVGETIDYVTPLGAKIVVARQRNQMQEFKKQEEALEQELVETLEKQTELDQEQKKKLEEELRQALDLKLLNMRNKIDPAKDYIALSSVCPHLGCQVHWQSHKKEFYCPCHQGRFNADGVGIAGPPLDAGQSLAQYNLESPDKRMLFIEVPVVGLTAPEDA